MAYLDCQQLSTLFVSNVSCPLTPTDGDLLEESHASNETFQLVKGEVVCPDPDLVAQISATSIIVYKLSGYSWRSPMPIDSFQEMIKTHHRVAFLDNPGVVSWNRAICC
eukprot:c17905_g1_i1 orf=30-356(+)